MLFHCYLAGKSLLTGLGYTYFMLKARLLGRFEVEINQEPVDIPSRPAQNLLAFLLLHPNTSHRREKLSGTLWPDSDETNARKYLSQQLWRLRKSLGEAYFKVDKFSVGLQPKAEIHVDVARFETKDSLFTDELIQHISLYDGPLLPDFYEDWIIAERSRLAAVFDRNIHTLLDSLIEEARWDDAIHWGEHWISLGEIPEPAFRALMIAHAGRGDQSAAAAIYRRCKANLKEELGVEPSKETTDLFENIRSGSFQAPSAKTSVSLRDGSPLKTLNGYELGEPLGTGVYGVVYLAYQLQVGREVAIKIIHPEHASSINFIKRFEIEAQLIAQLEHLHIVPLYDFWRNSDGAFLVMRLMKGGSLADMIADRRLELDEIARLVEQITSGLASAHRAGVIHRDIKPANILLDEEGNAYLSDFGIAKDLGSEGGLTGNGTVLGSPGYLSPEQVQSELISPQTDIYSLGVMLYELLAGQHPFPGASVGELLMKQVREPLPALEEIRPDLPSGLNAIVQRATSKDPLQRYPDVEAFAVDFREALGEGAFVRFFSEEEIAALHNPYKGLHAFTEKDSADFFGREAQTAFLLEEAETEPFVAIIGPSGSGKSSLVHAGLLAGLLADGDWLHASFRPGGQPIFALAGALIPLLEPQMSETEQLVETRKLAQALQGDDLPLVDVVERVLNKHPDKSRLVIIADQFEEVFTLVPEKAQQRKILDILLASINAQQFRPNSGLTLVLTLRADFFGQALAYRPLADALQNTTFTLGPMNREELAAAITLPAEGQGVGFESGLVDRILDDVASEPGNLPLLEFALTTMWTSLKKPLLTHDAYDFIGRVEGALSSYAESTYNELNKEEQSEAQQVLVQMIQPGQGTEDTRRLASKDEIGAPHWPIVQRLADTRLVVTGRDPAGFESVEIVHEALIRGWGRLRGWMAEGRAFRIWQERLRASLRQWEASQRDEGALLRGVPLAEAENWFQEHGEDLGEPERAYIQASLDLQQQRIAEQVLQRQARERLRQRINIGLTIGLVLTVILAVIAGWQWNLARQAQLLAESERDRADQQTQIAFERLSGQLATRALNLMEDQLDLGLLLSLEAYNIAETFEGRSSLWSALTLKPEYVTRMWGESVVTDVSFSFDGRTLAAGYEDGSVLLWEVPSGRLLQRLDGHSDEITSVEFSPVENFLATAGDDSLIILWDLDNEPVEKTQLIGHEKSVLSLAFSPDGRTLASGGVDDGIFLWDVDSGSHSGDPLEGDDSIQAIAFSPDGKILAFGNCSERQSLSFCAKNDIRLMDSATGEILVGPISNGDGSITSLAFSPNGKRLVTSSNLDEEILVWDIPAEIGNFGQVEPQTWGNDLLSHRSTGSIFSADGDAIFASGVDHSVLVLDVDGRISIGKSYFGHDGEISSLARGPDGRLLASGGKDGSIILWNLDGVGPLSMQFQEAALERIEWALESERWIAVVGISHQIHLMDTADPGTGGRMLEGHEAQIAHLRFSPDEKRMVSLDLSGRLIIWDTTTGEILGTPIENQLTFESQICQFSIGIQTLQISPDSRYLASAGRSGGVFIYDLATGQLLTELLTGREGNAMSLAFSADGSRLVSGGEDGKIIYWDIQSGQVLSETSPVNESGVNIIVSSPDGQRLFSGDLDTFGIWDSSPDSYSFGRRIGEPIPRCLGWFGPDFRTYVAFQSDFTIQFWDLESGTLIRDSGDDPESSNFRSTAVSPDGHLLATGTPDGSVTIWDMTSGEALFSELAGHENPVEEMVFSPDGTALISIEIGGQFILWDTATGQMVGDVLNLPQGELRSIAFSPDSQTLAIGVASGEIHLWEVSTGRKIGIPLASPPMLSGYARFTWNGSWLVSVSTTTVSLWSLDTESWPELACERANRNMTMAEWQEFFGTEPYRKTCPDLP